MNQLDTLEFFPTYMVMVGGAIYWNKDKPETYTDVRGLQVAIGAQGDVHIQGERYRGNDGLVPFYLQSHGIQYVIEWAV